MTFPSFGDAAVYDQLGRECAAALAGRGGTVFDACYHPVRPPGAVLLMAAPHVLTRDPVDASYISLAINVVFLAFCVLALLWALVGDERLLPGIRVRGPLLALVVFAATLANLIGHVPVRLADMPALAMFLAALAAAVRVLARSDGHRAAMRGYALAGGLCAAAVLLKISHAPVSLVLLATLLICDREARGRDGVRRAAAFLAPFALVALQVANVWAHTGRPWLYDTAYIDRDFAHAARQPSIEAVVFTIPAPGAYMAKTAVPLSPATFVVAKMARGVFGFEWAVYGGQPSRPEWWTPTAGELVGSWALVLAYLGFCAGCAWRGPPSLRLLGTVAAASAAITGLVTHTELRYYAFPRIVLWVSVAVLLVEAGHFMRARR